MSTMSIDGYRFKTDPYLHQSGVWRMSRDLEAFALFLDMGCGKSKVVVDTTGWLFSKKDIKSLIVVAPKSVYRNWYVNEVPRHLPDDIPRRMAWWACDMNAHEQRAIDQVNQPGDFLRVLLVNVEAFNKRNTEAADFLKAFMKRGPALLCIDESTVIKSPKAQRTKILLKLRDYAAYRRICSGNPMPQAPTDIYTQSEFLKKNMMGFGSVFAFRNRFCLMEDQYFGKRAFKTVVGYRDLDELTRLINKFSFVIKKQDCLDLPSRTYQIAYTEMGPKQRRAYEQMKHEASIELSQGLVTAPIVLTKLMRLQQISCGFVTLDDGREVDFEDSRRINDLLEILENHQGKAIIWCNFTHDIERVSNALEEVYGDFAVARYYGKTSQEDRLEATRRIQEDPATRFIVANQSAGKFCNTWTAADLMIYYSNDYNAESRQQSEDRNYRIGQDKPVTVIDLQAYDSVDPRVLNILQAKQKISDSVIVSNWKWLLGIEEERKVA